jgi:4,5-dihydroxyphthalate decarboxylase
MPQLTLSVALANYGHTRPLQDGSIGSDKVALEYIEVSPITTAFRRMVRGLDYDVAEMALSTYLCALAHNKPMTALPVFVLRRFEHSGIVYNTKSGIKSPADLAGRRVGVRSYTLTPGVWVRGILQSVYGVDLDQVTWVLVGDEHVAEYVAPPNVVSAPPGSDLASMLVSGEVDAAIGAGNVDSPDVQPLIPDARNAAIDYFNRTGVYPISHAVVVKDQLLGDNPWLAEELFSLFQGAKEQYLGALTSGATQDSGDAAMLQMRQVIGEDPLPYGVAANRQTLERFIQFNVEQKIIPEAVRVEDIFPSSLVDIAR